MDFWFWLNTVANVAQLESYRMNQKQVDNGTLLKYMQHQDNDLLETLIKQNEQIIKQNQELLDILRKGE